MIPRPVRAFGRWITDWRNGATLIAAVIVALLVLIVVDNIQSRRGSDERADRTLAELATTVEELQRRGIRIDELAEQLEETSESRDRLAEEVRALRELLIDRGIVEPRPLAAQTSGPAPRSTSAPMASSPQPQPIPGPPTQPPPSPPPPPEPTPNPPPPGSPLCQVTPFLPGCDRAAALPPKSGR